jgi:hypothetical protein
MLCIAVKVPPKRRLNFNGLYDVISQKIIFCWKIYHCQSEHECATCMMVLRAVRCVLNSTHHDRWIGRGGPIAWPLRLPHSNPLNFYLRWHLKSLVYAAPVRNNLWMPVRLSATALAYCMELAVRDGTCRGVHWITWSTLWALVINADFHTTNDSILSLLNLLPLVLAWYQLSTMAIPLQYFH